MPPHWSATDGTGHVWRYLRCSSCGLVRLDIEADQKDWERLSYQAEYYGEGYSKFRGAVQALRELSALRRASEIHRLFDAPGRVLDIGCGEGLFLASMKALGWNTEGCEIGDVASRRAEARLGQPIHHGSFETLPQREPWNVIMLWHVLEHVPEPAAFIEALGRSLAPGGLLIAAIPNADSWQAELFGPDWFHLDPPRHLHSFGIRHVRRLADRAGLEIAGVRHFSLEYNPYGWAQSLLNRLGWRRDAMYEALKRGRSPGGAAKVVLRMLAWFLLFPSVLPAAAEALARRGGTVVFHLRRGTRAIGDPDRSAI